MQLDRLVLPHARPPIPLTRFRHTSKEDQKSQKGNPFPQAGNNAHPSREQRPPQKGRQPVPVGNSNHHPRETANLHYRDRQPPLGRAPVPTAHIVSAIWGSGTAIFIFVSAIFGNVSATFRSSPPRKRRPSLSRCRALPPNGTTHQANPSSHRWELNGNLDGNLDFARDGL